MIKIMFINFVTSQLVKYYALQSSCRVDFKIIVIFAPNYKQGRVPTKSNIYVSKNQITKTR